MDIAMMRAADRESALYAQRRKGYSSVPRTRGGAVMGEMKYFDTRLAATAIPSVAAWTGTEFDPTTYLTLCVPVVGAAINQRIGRSIKIVKIRVRGQIRTEKKDEATGQNASQIRLALVQDMQTNATQAQGEQVFTATTTANEAPLAMQNIDSFGRFRVLKDQTFNIGNPSAITSAGAEVNGLVTSFKWNVTFSTPVEVRFNATNGGTIADIVDNSFHIMANANGIELAPTICYVARVCYKE